MLFLKTNRGNTIKVNYEKTDLKVTVYGEEYTLPKKTVKVIQVMDSCQAAIGKGIVEEIKAHLEFMRFFFGNDFIDTDEMPAVILTVINLYSANSAKVAADCRIKCK